MIPRTLLLIASCSLLTGAAPALHKVVIDPGHGGENEGAPCPFTGKFEKEYSLDIALRVAKHLRDAGVEVILTREKDTFVSLQDRVRLANRVGAEALVSIHINATDVPGPTGHETFFLSLDATDEAARRLALFENQERGVSAEPGETPGGDVEDILRDLNQNRAHHDAEKLAAHIQRNLTKRSPFKNRGVKQAPFAVLKGASMPAVVVEVGFINHRKEGRFITSLDGRRRLARGIADGLLDFGRLVLAPRALAPPTLAPKIKDTADAPPP